MTKSIEAILRGISRLEEFPESRQSKEELLWVLAKWRSNLLTNTVVQFHGTTVQSGPFKGMEFVKEVAEGCVAPKLFGHYESNVHHIVERIVATGYDNIVDIGCAEGYYAVGFARRMPRTKVYGFDISEHARKACVEIAEKNHVNVSVAGEFRGEDFATYADQHSLIFIDAEGAEDALLRPDIYPALNSLSVFVECHDTEQRKLSKELETRFAATHSIERVECDLMCPPLPEWTRRTTHLDQLLAVWEWRAYQTPWLYMTPKRA